MGEYTEKRNRDFMIAFRREMQELWKRGEEVNVEKVIERVVAGEARVTMSATDMRVERSAIW